ncbi:MAG: hypothetical protein BWX71_02357 [Deltaproteobacteria bacterium ADurb.Bin072]|nr:MAG: hypothetical protein BWX71_02357 [Deltaproteobacteria bacterium ADurb.Bin072]
MPKDVFPRHGHELEAVHVAEHLDEILPLEVVKVSPPPWMILVPDGLPGTVWGGADERPAGVQVLDQLVRVLVRVRHMLQDLRAEDTVEGHIGPGLEVFEGPAEELRLIPEPGLRRPRFGLLDVALIDVDPGDLHGPLRHPGQDVHDVVAMGAPEVQHGLGVRPQNSTEDGLEPGIPLEVLRAVVHATVLLIFVVPGIVAGIVPGLVERIVLVEVLDVLRQVALVRRHDVAHLLEVDGEPDRVGGLLRQLVPEDLVPLDGRRLPGLPLRQGLLLEGVVEGGLRQDTADRLGEFLLVHGPVLQGKEDRPGILHGLGYRRPLGPDQGKTGGVRLKGCDAARILEHGRVDVELRLAHGLIELPLAEVAQVRDVREFLAPLPEIPVILRHLGRGIVVPAHIEVAVGQHGHDGIVRAD